MSPEEHLILQILWFYVLLQISILYFVSIVSYILTDMFFLCSTHQILFHQLMISHHIPTPPSPFHVFPGAPKRPLICWPHGGPHSTVANMFYFEPSFFVKLGYSIVFPNYRGSLGFGEDGVNALPGHVGTVDVSDVHQAVTSCLERWVSAWKFHRKSL